MIDGNFDMLSTVQLLIISAISPSPYVIRVHYQVVVMLSIVCLMTSLLVYVFFYMYYKSTFEKKHVKWRLISDLLINNTVFYDDDDELKAENWFPGTDGVERLIHNKHFRKFLTGEIMKAKKNIAGTAADNLKLLYSQLKLEQYALKNLKSRYWHIKAKAIQELTVMEMKEFIAELYQYTNDNIELVRMEAQTAIVQFNGFEGLRFLDIITYPISDWQQIKLLQQLSTVPPANIDIDGWLQSANSSVVVFALKLARNYHRFEMHDHISACLDHPDPKARMEAIYCLSEIYTDETSDQLISRFLKEDVKHQLAMVKAMQNIGSEKDVLFLLDILDSNNDEIKLCAARAIAHIGKNGLESLENHPGSAKYPLKEMVMQIKGELAA
jgi:hypothetical protein